MSETALAEDGGSVVPSAEADLEKVALALDEKICPSGPGPHNAFYPCECKSKHPYTLSALQQVVAPLMARIEDDVREIQRLDKGQAGLLARIAEVEAAHKIVKAEAVHWAKEHTAAQARTQELEKALRKMAEGYHALNQLHDLAIEDCQFPSCHQVRLLLSSPSAEAAPSPEPLIYPSDAIWPREERPWAIPGHCVSIDGDRWHEQGKCASPSCDTTCCGPRAAPTQEKE